MSEDSRTSKLEEAAKHPRRTAIILFTSFAATIWRPVLSPADDMRALAVATASPLYVMRTSWSPTLIPGSGDSDKGSVDIVSCSR